MSIHVQLTTEAQSRLRAQNRTTTITSIVITVLTIALLALLLFFIFLKPLMIEVPTIVTYQGSQEDDAEISKKKIVNQVQKKPAAASSNIAKVIASTSPSNVTIPIPEVDTPDPSSDFGSSADFGSGWGGDGAGFGGGKMTPFGRVGGGGLQGSLYDLKQDRSKKTNKQYMVSTYQKLEKSRFSDSSLRDFYKAPENLSFTNLVMSAQTDAAIGPESFGAKKEVEPSAWIVVYQGRLGKVPSGDYQFVGLFDDILMVYVDDKLVLDASFGPDYSNLKQVAKPGAVMRRGKPMIVGKWVSLRQGVKLKIIVGESPGGHLGGGLFIREKGKKYDQEEGGDVLPPFTTVELSAEDKSRMKKIPMMNLSGNFPIELNDVPVFLTQ